MNWSFSLRMSACDKEAGLILIRHLQKMYAYQQLNTERYNDALAIAARTGTFINEGLFRPMENLSDVLAVKEHILPALQMKVQILQKMENEHRNIEQPKNNILKTAYIDFSQLVITMQERTRLQYKCFNAWIQDQTQHSGTKKLDKMEMKALDRSIYSLNKLIKKVNLDEDRLLDIFCEAINSVRKTVDLSSMKVSEFRKIYFSGLAGKAARFFAS